MVNEEKELVGVLIAGRVLKGDPRYAQEEMRGFGWRVVYNCVRFAGVTSGDTQRWILEAIMSIGGQPFRMAE